MQTNPTSSGKNQIEATVTIQRPVSEVFAFYRDFKNLPSFLGDVMEIEPTGPATSRWTIEGPFGIRVHWTMEVTEERTNELIRYETATSSATKTYWEIYFSPGAEPGETQVREVMKAPGGLLVMDALALIGKFPAQEVAANLHRFKQIMETGRVTDTTYAVSGKFPKS
ncbi:MAG TPA: SRPBCC family protein [Terriglobales bacterium]